MDFNTALVMVLSGVALAAGVQLILAKNTVKATLSLVLTFFATAGLWLMLELEFLAFSLILVYVGAVMVLFLFVVMMIDVEKEKAGFTPYLPLGVSVAVLVVVGLVYGLSAPQFQAANTTLSDLPSTPITGSQVKALGQVLYTQFLYPLEIVGLLLLVAMVAAISLTFKGRRPGNKAISPADQVRVQKSERVRLVKGLKP